MFDGNEKRGKFPSDRIIDRRYKLDKILTWLRIFGRNKTKEDLSHNNREVSRAGTSPCKPSLDSVTKCLDCAQSIFCSRITWNGRVKKRATRYLRLRLSSIALALSAFLPQNFRSKERLFSLHSAHHLESSLPSLSKFLKVQSSTIKLKIVN